ncbi:DUF58 domain-containing protein [Paenibacillus sp. MMS18-CY102]|uniref:DUF58 domain-containing protein n=1 Tax=Paenibacillus sp. MMS18-CY102 TaxID=2682849 RepID=UPI001365BB72|nr:DUF58 domain-containing protein [Paenibacillus sp. MMS18-CY102]MWC29918.1 DUF58 domain-containing protein [Paenibacillus sp. MMS18-CY102]
MNGKQRVKRKRVGSGNGQTGGAGGKGSLAGPKGVTGQPSHLGKSSAAVLSPQYRTRSYLWALFISGWAIALGAALWRGEKPELFVAFLLTGIGMIGLLPVLMASLAQLEASRSLSQPEGQAGGDITVTVMLRSRIPLPLVWLAFRETLVNESGANERIVVFRQIMLPRWRKEWAVSYTVKELERGVYRFLDCEATIGDVLGLTAISRRFTARRHASGKAAEHARHQAGSVQYSPVNRADTGMTLLVMPEWKGSAEAVSAGGRANKAGDGRYGAPSAGGHSRLAESKQRRAAAAWPHTAADPSGAQRLPYRPGDDARRIDWRAASRGGIWLTKRDRTEWPPELVLLLDTSVEAYGGDDRIFDCAAGYMAALVRHAARADKPFRMVWSAAEEPVLHGAFQAKGAARASRVPMERAVLEQLGSIRPVHAAERVAASLEQRLADVPRGASLVVVTADWRSSELGERVSEIAAANGLRVEIHVLAPQRVPSLGMRERKRDWECAGIRVVWVSLPELGPDSAGAVAEGGDGHG